MLAAWQTFVSCKLHPKLSTFDISNQGKKEVLNLDTLTVINSTVFSDWILFSLQSRSKRSDTSTRTSAHGCLAQLYVSYDAVWSVPRSASLRGSSSFFSQGSARLTPSVPAQPPGSQHPRVGQGRRLPAPNNLIKSPPHQCHARLSCHNFTNSFAWFLAFHLAYTSSLELVVKIYNPRHSGFNCPTN